MSDNQGPKGAKIRVVKVTDADCEKALRLIVRARIQLLLQQPFFGSLAMGLEPTVAHWCDTMATDGRRLYYGVPFVLQLAKDEIGNKHLVAVLAHECMHVAQMHVTRRGLRDPVKWNIACDYAINVTLAEACESSRSSMAMPPDCFLDKKYTDMSSEQIYDLLENEKKKCKAGGKGDKGKADGQDGGGESDGDGDPGKDPGGMGGVIDAVDAHGNPLSEADRSALEADIKVSVFQAAMTAKSRGLLPGCLERLVEQMRQPQIDWRDRLRRFWAAQFPSDYSISRPARRGIHAGMYLPGVIKDGVGEIAVVIDTSGSVGPEELAQFIGEINSIADENTPEKLHVLSCDAKVHTHQVFSPGDTVDHTTIKVGGGGGTSFKPPFEWLSEKGVEPKCLIYLTDMYGDFPSDPGYPTLWVATSDQIGPFGETVRINLSQQ